LEEVLQKTSPGWLTKWIRKWKKDFGFESQKAQMVSAIIRVCLALLQGIFFS